MVHGARCIFPHRKVCMVVEILLQPVLIHDNVAGVDFLVLVILKFLFKIGFYLHKSTVFEAKFCKMPPV